MDILLYFDRHLYLHHRCSGHEEEYFAQIPLCSAHLEKYRALRFASAVLLLGCIPEMIVAGNYSPELYMGWGIAAGLLAMVAGLACLIMFSSLLHAKRIDRHYGYFSSASPAFLQLLSEPPPGMIIPRWN